MSAFERDRDAEHTASFSIHTYLAACGVPKAQIDTAAGHSTDDGTGDRYNHLRPSYITEFIEGIESFWKEVGRFTDAHLRCQCDTSDTKKPLFSFPVRSSTAAEVYENIEYESGAPEGIRTPDPCLRRAVLYPAELPVRGRCL